MAESSLEASASKLPSIKLKSKVENDHLPKNLAMEIPGMIDMKVFRKDSSKLAATYSYDLP